jgi:anthranilate phosphoribosyltransferase
MSLKDALRILSDGKDLSEAAARSAFLELMEGGVTESQKGALLLGLAARGETPAEMAGAVSALRQKMTPVTCPRRPLLDTCGTGGDGAATFNVSTAAAFVCAGAGVAVAKHGNRAVSSRCGSADVLEALGVPLEKAPESAAQDLESTGFAFLFAPAFHPAMKQVSAVRRELGVRTIFNLVGPLANPARPSHQLIGVGRFEVAHLLAKAMALLETRRTIVFHSENGLDELTPGVAAIGFEVRAARVTRWRFDPGVLAQREVARGDLSGGEAAENAKTLENVLGGDPGPIRETVLLNSAAALWVAEAASTLHDGYEMASESIDRGKAIEVLRRARSGEGR